MVYYKNISEDVWVTENPGSYRFEARSNSAQLYFLKEQVEEVYTMIKDVRKNKQTDNYYGYSDKNVSLQLDRLRTAGVNTYNLNFNTYNANNWFCKKLDIVIEYLEDKVINFNKLKAISNRETIKELLKDYSIESLKRILEEAGA